MTYKFEKVRTKTNFFELIYCKYKNSSYITFTWHFCEMYWTIEEFVVLFKKQRKNLETLAKFCYNRKAYLENTIYKGGEYFGNRTT